LVSTALWYGFGTHLNSCGLRSHSIRQLAVGLIEVCEEVHS